MIIGSSDMRSSANDYELYLACLWMSAGIMMVRLGIKTED